MSRYNKPFIGHWIMVLCNSAFQSIFSYTINNLYFVFKKEHTVIAHLLMTRMKKNKLARSLRVNTVII